METFIHFFENLSSVHKLAWIFICLSLSWFLEFATPLSILDYKKWKHAIRNLAFLGTSLIINLVMGLLTVSVFIWLSEHSFGVFNWFSLNVWLELLLAVMMLDLCAQYLVHYLLHKVKWMWKLHLVHHSDTKVDATTGTRHHPGDYFVRELFALATICLFGIPLGIYLFYKICTIFFTYTSHANIQLPKWLDKALVTVFITPNMHKFHHHFERPWTDSNFGNIFSLWDRLFGTFVYDDPKKVVYGLDTVDASKDENLAYQFGLPFNSSIKTDY